MSIINRYKCLYCITLVLHHSSNKWKFSLESIVLLFLLPFKSSMICVRENNIVFHIYDVQSSHMQITITKQATSVPLILKLFSMLNHLNYKDCYLWYASLQESIKLVNQHEVFYLQNFLKSSDKSFHS